MRRRGLPSRASSCAMPSLGFPFPACGSDARSIGSRMKTSSGKRRPNVDCAGTRKSTCCAGRMQRAAAIRVRRVADDRRSISQAGAAFSGRLSRVAKRRASSAAIWAKTGDQSPQRDWRNSRIDGYQGLSDRAWSHLASAASESASQTGTPSAPARWPSAVSGVTTRSSDCIAAAVSRKS